MKDVILDPVLIHAPYCSRCNRTEGPVIVRGDTAKELQRLLHHVKGNVCCKTCGSVMSLEMAT